ncbi:hypothetical protein AURDEDRAFT_186980 [Auricularia subglabra TFB-10046 SS5]|nr:hypothetical protein AURDEDRAFT_186980 [Auricularia subglabra TFB-10046 SS5]
MSTNPQNARAQSQPVPDVALPDVHPVNFLSIARKGAVTGEYLINAALRMPESVLVPQDAGEGGVRPNLRLASDDATVDVDVWVARPRPAAPDSESAPADSDAPAPTRLIFQGLGPVGVRLHTLGVGPATVDVTSVLQGVAVTIPRDFEGLVMTSTTRGNATQVPRQCKTLSEVRGEGRFFVGDASKIGPNGWTGTTLKISAPHGGIKVALADGPIPWGPIGAGVFVFFLLVAGCAS